MPESLLLLFLVFKSFFFFFFFFFQSSFSDSWEVRNSRKVWGLKPFWVSWLCFMGPWGMKFSADFLCPQLKFPSFFRPDISQEGKETLCRISSETFFIRTLGGKSCEDLKNFERLRASSRVLQISQVESS